METLHDVVTLNKTGTSGIWQSGCVAIDAFGPVFGGSAILKLVADIKDLEKALTVTSHRRHSLGSI